MAINFFVKFKKKVLLNDEGFGTWEVIVMLIFTTFIINAFLVHQEEHLKNPITKIIYTYMNYLTKVLSSIYLSIGLIILICIVFIILTSQKYKQSIYISTLSNTHKNIWRKKPKDIQQMNTRLKNYYLNEIKKGINKSEIEMHITLKSKSNFDGFTIIGIFACLLVGLTSFVNNRNQYIITSLNLIIILIGLEVRSKLKHKYATDILNSCKNILKEI